MKEDHYLTLGLVCTIRKVIAGSGNTDIDVNTDINTDIDLNTDTDTNDCCRFPCCGKAFPCDVCHDSTEDHPMERANRMICGYCSKEQVHIHTYIHFKLLMNKFCLMLMI